MYDDGIKQPYFGVVAKGAPTDREEEFKSVIRDTLQGIADNGFDEKALLSAINHFEFQYREADFQGPYVRHSDAGQLAVR